MEAVLGGTSWHRVAGLALPTSQLLERQQYLLDLQVNRVATETESPCHAPQAALARAARHAGPL